MTFYDNIADCYDDMTGADEREAAAAAAVAEITQRFAIHSALDAACGTGVHAVAVARSGVRTVGSDIAASMLDQARARAEAAGVNVRWVQSPMQDLAGRLHDTFDAVLCLGNSLPHLLTDEDLDATIAGFAKLLNEGGVAILHVLNYARILSCGERVVHVSRQGDTEYVRFYDFGPGRVRFNILKLTWNGDACRHALHSTEHRPYRADELAAALSRHGMTDLRRYGSLRFASFDEDKSPALVITARMSPIG